MTVTVTVTDKSGATANQVLTYSTGVSGRKLGVNWQSIWQGSTGQATLLAHFDAAKPAWVRTDAIWSLIETTQGQRSGGYLANLDTFVASMKARNVPVTLVVGGAPAWAAGGTGGPSAPPLPAYFSAYGDFCAWLVTRYGTAVEAIEVWNEPSGSWAWANGTNGGCLGQYPGNTLSLYPTLLKTAYPKIKAARADVKVLAGSVFTMQWSDWRTKAYVQALYDNGCKDFFDILAAHSYPQHVTQLYPAITAPNQPYVNPTTPRASIVGQFTTELLPYLTSKGDANREVWLNETGLSTAGTGANSGTEAQQAAKVTELRNSLAGFPPNVTRAYWYNLLDGKASQNSDTEYNWGLVDNLTENTSSFTAANLRAKPSLAAFGN